MNSFKEKNECSVVAQSVAGSAHFCGLRRRFIAITAGVVALCLSGGGQFAFAEKVSFYDGSRPIELIVPGGPGAGTDIVARLVAKGISEQLGNQVVVKNIPGAAGILAAQAGARAKPDGYHLFFGITGTNTVNQFLYPDLSYDPINDFDAVSLVCRYNNVLVVRPDFEAQNFEDFIALMKENPGEYFYGITLVGSSSNLAMEFLKSQAGLELPGVPYGSGASAVNDFLGGQYPVLMDTVINQLPHIQDGRVVPLATTGAERSPVLPDVPTIIESGYPEVEGIGWGGIMAPAGTPKEAIQELNNAIKAVIESSAFDSLKASGLEMAYTTPEEMDEYIKTESEKWGKVVEIADIKPAN